MSEQTISGKMTGASQSQDIEDRFAVVLWQWQAAANREHYDVSEYTHPNDQVHGHFGAKYARLDIGSSGAFMVELSTGTIYGIKGYGKVDKKKNVGNIALIDAAVLVRDRFRHGRFVNNANGSIAISTEVKR